MTLRRSDLGTHEQDECPARLQRCSYCEEQVKLNEMEVLHAGIYSGNTTSCCIVWNFRWHVRIVYCM